MDSQAFSCSMLRVLLFYREVLFIFILSVLQLRFLLDFHDCKRQAMLFSNKRESISLTRLHFLLHSLEFFKILNSPFVCRSEENLNANDLQKAWKYSKRPYTTKHSLLLQAKWQQNLPIFFCSDFPLSHISKAFAATFANNSNHSAAVSFALFVTRGCTSMVATRRLLLMPIGLCPFIQPASPFRSNALQYCKIEAFCCVVRSANERERESTTVVALWLLQQRKIDGANERYKSWRWENWREKGEYNGAKRREKLTFSFA